MEGNRKEKKISGEETLIGVSTSSLREFPLEKRFEIIQRDGFQIVEINLNYDPLDTVKSLKEILKELEIKVAVHSAHDKMDFDDCSPETFRRSVDSIEEEISFVEEIGAEYYVFHVTKNGDLENILSVLKELIPKRINAIYENSGVGNGASEREIQRILEYLDVPFNLDFGHLWRAINNGFVSLDVSEFVKKFKKKIVYAHLHDNDGIHDNHWALGKGTVPFARILENIDKKIPLVIETRGSYRDVKASKEILKKWI